jgi:hypothetical protein
LVIRLLIAGAADPLDEPEPLPLPEDEPLPLPEVEVLPDPLPEEDPLPDVECFRSRCQTWTCYLIHSSRMNHCQSRSQATQ